MEPTTAKRKLTRDEILRRRENSRPHFDVTCSIGRVYLDGEGDQTPHEAAMLLIARYDGEGEYRFPAPDGRTTVVAVSYEEV